MSRKYVSFFEALVVLTLQKKTKIPSAIISFDTESPIDSPVNDLNIALREGAKERKGLENIIALMKEFEISFTFFVTGHALLKECEGHRRRVEILKSSRYFKRGLYTWSQIDPASNYVKYPELYYGDLVEVIARSRLAEIGSHSFSHIPYSAVSDDTALEDLRLVRSAFELYGLKLTSFAFPYNLAGKYHLLKMFGIKIARAGHFRMPRLYLNKDGLVVLRSHITDIPFGKEIFEKLVKHAAKQGGVISWYLHPKTLTDDNNYKIFREVITAMKKHSIEFKTVSEFFNELILECKEC